MFFPYRDDVPTRRISYVNITLITLNVLAFLWLASLPPERQREIPIRHGFIPKRLSTLNHAQALAIEAPAVVDPRARQVVLQPKRFELQNSATSIGLSMLTCMFLHGGWAHVLGNMWFLWLFGNNVEDRLGHVLYVIFYLLGGIAATLVHWWTTPDSAVPVIGASGAVAAVLGAYAVTWPWARIHCVVVLFVFITFVDVPALVVLGTWFLTQFLEAQRAVDIDINGGVAWWAHIGGFVVGALVMLLFGPRGTESAPEIEIVDERW